MTVHPTVKVDVSRLNRGLGLAMQYTTRAPAECCNFAAKEVAFAAFDATPVTGASRVDADMGTVATPVIGVRGGKTKKNNYSSGVTKRVVKNGKVVNVPVAVLIVQKRGVAGSKYNTLTGGRYALPSSPFKDVTPTVGRYLMRMLVDKMIKGRRRSASGFIRAGWIKAMKVFKSLAPKKYGGKSSIPSGQNDALGDAVPAQPGKVETFAIVENDVGLRNQDPQHNQALQRVGGPALQYAVDKEGAAQMNYYLRKSSGEELEKPVNAQWS